MEKRSISLQRYFTRSLLLAALGVILLAAAFLLLFQVMMQTGLVAPSNAGETEARSEIMRQKESPALMQDLKAVYYDYIYFDSNESVKGSNLTDDEIQKAIERYPDQNASYTTGEYISYPDGSTCLFFWQYAVKFTDPGLQKLLPGVEPSLLVLFGVCLIVLFLLFTRRMSRSFSRKLSLVESASTQIADQNLENAVPTSVGIREFDHALRAMEHMRAALKTSLSEQWQLEQQRSREITALAHDLKTPLTVIGGNAELLLEEELNEEQTELTQSILTAGTRAQDYVKVLGQLSRFDMAEEAAGQFEVSEWIGKALLILKPLADQKKVCIEVKSIDHLWPVWGYGSLLVRALVNIGENAIRFSPEGGEISITANQTDERLQLTVQDEGEGFSREALLHAKEPLWQQDLSRNTDGSFGMGLAIADKVAAKHGAGLSLKNTEKGACVTLVLTRHLT